ncbi:Rz1-like lysis system protein LysC [Yersinia bercovieri]|uniref:Rz1-like lysis system protein LysC n=1 Tax=Yersinia bercovieri TaxID=634 RepID=UPI0011A63D4E|nr:hypothetical protein [Yersinia bercovieri]
MENSSSQKNQVKAFFKDSVSFLASVLVLVAGSYYLSAIYFSEKITLLASVMYLISAISFSALTVISLGYVSSDAYRLCRKLSLKRMRFFVWIIIVFNAVGYIGTIAVSAANINQAVKFVVIPDEYRKPNLPPEIPEEMTWGQLVVITKQTMEALEQCNNDKVEILKRVDKK